MGAAFLRQVQARQLGGLSYLRKVLQLVRWGTASTQFIEEQGFMQDWILVLAWEHLLKPQMEGELLMQAGWGLWQYCHC